MESLIGRIIQFRDERNWQQYNNPKDLAISITIEASELLELFQWETSDSAVEGSIDDIKDELADILIYALTLAHDLEINVEQAVLNKMKKNALKYPINHSVNE